MRFYIDIDQRVEKCHFRQKTHLQNKMKNIYRIAKWWWCCDDDDNSGPASVRVMNHAACWNCRQLMSTILVKPAKQVKSSFSLSLSLARSLFFDVCSLISICTIILSFEYKKRTSTKVAKKSAIFAFYAYNELLPLFVRVYAYVVFCVCSM